MSSLYATGVFLIPTVLGLLTAMRGHVALTSSLTGFGAGALLVNALYATYVLVP